MTTNPTDPTNPTDSTSPTESPTEARLRATLSAVSIVDAPRADALHEVDALPRYGTGDALPRYGTGDERTSTTTGRVLALAAAGAVVLGVVGAVALGRGTGGPTTTGVPVAAGPSTASTASTAPTASTAATPVSTPVVAGPSRLLLPVGFDVTSAKVSPGPRSDGGVLWAVGDRQIVYTDFVGTESRSAQLTIADGTNVVTTVIDESPWDAGRVRALPDDATSDTNADGATDQAELDAVVAASTPYAGPVVDIAEAGLSYVTFPATPISGGASAMGGNDDVTVLVSVTRTDGQPVDLEAVLRSLRLTTP